MQNWVQHDSLIKKNKFMGFLLSIHQRLLAHTERSVSCIVMLTGLSWMQWFVINSYNSELYIANRI